METRLPDARLYVSPDPGSTYPARKRKDFSPMPLSDATCPVLPTSGQHPGSGARQPPAVLDPLGTAATPSRHLGSFRPH